MACALFRVCLLLASIMSVTFTHVVESSRVHPCSRQYSVPLCEYATTNASSLLLVNICFLLVLVVLFLASFSSFLLFPVMKEATVKSPFSVLLEICTHLCWVRNQEWDY